MDDKFYDGQEIKAIFFPGEQILAAGTEDCDRITVSLELDQVWLVVWKGLQVLTKWNGQHVEGLDIDYEKALQ